MVAAFPEQASPKSQVETHDLLPASSGLRGHMASAQPHSFGQDCGKVCPESSGGNHWFDRRGVTVTQFKGEKKKKARATGDTVVAVFGNHPLGPSHVQKALANLADTWLHGKQETPDPPLGHASGITGISPDM